MKLSHTNIEYALGGYGWNFYPGCKHNQTGVCPVTKCWAEAMSKRQKWDFHEPRLVPELLLAPLSIKKPSVILVNFMGDLGGEWVDPESPRVLSAGELDKAGFIGRPGQERILVRSIKEWVFKVIKSCPQHTFLFLTKNLAAWAKWGKWPDNAWVGASVCNQEMLIDALVALAETESKHKWLSIEPLFEALNGGECDGRGKVKRLDGIKYAGIEWVVIGQQSPVRPETTPKIEWIREIVEAADQAGVRVWLKDNLHILLRYAMQGLPYPSWATMKATENVYVLRQEVPWG